LLQYQEVFHHQALLLGALATWQMNAQWQINSQLRVGRISTARIDVPHLSFDMSLASKSLKTAQVSIAYRINQHWQAAVTADYQRYGYGESAISNSFFEPASKTKQRSVLAGMYYYY
jgi:outer membrane scaffolding protein for murein synthesis (MipA/OmpV family)